MSTSRRSLRSQRSSLDMRRFSPPASPGQSRWLRSIQARISPAALIAGGFAGAILIGTLLLCLPIASESREWTEVTVAAFTATSAVCVTGLIVVDTPTHWSLFGEWVILGLIQVGGLGIMTVASLLGLVVFRRLGLRMKLIAQAETKTLGLGEVRRVVRRLLLLSLAFELVVCVALTLRLVLGYDRPLLRGLYEGLFHAVSAFNNAGFSLYSANLMDFARDPWFCLPIVVAVIAGGLGFPVWLEIGRWGRNRRHRWSLHSKITLVGTAVLIAVGTVAVSAAEWGNPATLGPMTSGEKLLVGFFHGVMPRTAGFNSLDPGGMYPATLLVNDVLMFIGGGSAGTAGGIKITTFALLGFVLLAEIRGQPTVHVWGRRLSAGVQRQALTVVLLAVGAVVFCTFVLLVFTPFDLDQVLFEVISAFATVGLSTGITDDLPGFGQWLLIALMFTGRLGPITLASALALRERARRYELPEERPIVG